MKFGEIISWPFAKLMLFLYEFVNNYGVAVILFALIVNLIMTPFMAKSKKSMMRTSRLQPKIQELQRRHEGNPQKLQAEMQKLYQEEGVNPASGCIWSLLPFPILIALYSVIRQPITRLMYAGKAVVEGLEQYFAADLTGVTGRATAYKEIVLTDLLHNDFSGAKAYLTELANQDPANVNEELLNGIAKLKDIDFSFLKLNLGTKPDWHTIFTGPWTWAAIGLFLIPFVSAALSWLSMKVANAANPTATQDAQSQGMTKGMTLFMPLMSIWICFSMPAAMGVYWIANSIFAMTRDFILTKVFKKQMAIEDAERLAARSEREKELEAKREETERLKAEGKTEVNTNTSKKKLQASEKQQNAERRAAAEKAERAARRERLGIKENEKPASQVGNRRYARGRAYVPDRFDNPDHAEEATLAAAAESEGAAAIDDTVDEVSDPGGELE